MSRRVRRLGRAGTQNTKSDSGSAAAVYIHPGTVSAAFSYSLLRVFVAEICGGRVPILIAQRSGSGQVPESRNETVAYFLDETQAEWFWSVDSDMGFGPSTLSDLIASADPVERPMVGALCFGVKKLGQDDLIQSTDLRCFPTLYAFVETETEVGWQAMTDYPRDSLVQVGGTGAACFVAHRSLLERMRSAYGDTWFDKIDHPKGPTRFGEDLSFCVRVAGVDAPIFVDTAIKTSHDKGGIFFTEAQWSEQQDLLAFRSGVAELTRESAA